MAMYCDLNILEATSFNENLSNIKQAVKLGFEIIAINRIVGVPKKLTKGTSSKAEVESMKKLLEKIMIELKQDSSLTIPKKFKLLSRATFIINTNEELNNLRISFYVDMIAKFDIIAYTLSNEKMFKIILQGKLIDVDIISFPLENKLEFTPTRELIGLASSKEVAFEICYSQAIKSVSLRKHIFHNGRMLVNKVKYGRGIILCSGGEQALDLRGPKDVVNLSNLFDLKGAACQEVVSKNCQRVVRRSLLRNTTFKGAVSVEKIEGKEKGNEPAAKKVKLT